MEFTYKSYVDMITLLKQHGYKFSNYNYNNDDEKIVILRHDVDFNLEKALEFARLEHKLNVKSIYFILLSTNFYNIYSKRSFDIMQEILSLGHEIGLHFDETKYQIKDVQDLETYVEFERKLLGQATNTEIESVSMHRPSKWILSEDVKFENCINSYSNEFFKKFKYVSDSRMNWREDVISIIKEGNFNKLHILTHPFWYSEEIQDMKYKLSSFIDSAKKERFTDLKDNFTDIDSVLGKED